MIVGIIADTHDRLPLLDKAVKRLNEERVELVLHAGDYVAPFVVPHFKSLKANLIGVFGNNDGDKELLKSRFTEIGAEIRGKFAEVIVDKLRIALLHGDEMGLLQSLIDVGNYDIVVHGHTHEAKTYRKEATLVINPGEICGYLNENPSMTILDTQTLDAKTILLK
ncbi:MAG: metallophosphoesterase [Candidatus Bathyarchaeota archaeon]|nr:MAG: metallophosphoesterase [Candidatus Bathyarchaeota archaeon]UCE57286.1 MAG: metallophosphoesterase [Candidatus Bathyarchaeota archaeon]